MTGLFKKGTLILMAAFLLLGLCVSPVAAEKSVATEHYSDDMLCDVLPSEENTTVLDIKAKSVVLMEPKTGKVLYEKNSGERVAPASITKIMTLLLVMEAIESKKINLQTEVVTSEHAASMGGSQIWLEFGETMTVDEMLRASVIASANDATVALAELIAGSEESFVTLMNEKAKELGMKGTVFVNACGLDAEGHYTTAYDVAIMSSALIKHELIKKYSTVWMDALRDGKSELVNTNKLVRYYKGATGLKTGTTSAAGCCVAASAKRDGLELVAVVMKGENSNERFAGAKKLLDYGFANWEFTTLEGDASKIGEIICKKGRTERITPQTNGKVNLLISKGNKDKVKEEILIDKEITAPVKKGERVGKIKFTLDGKGVGEIEIVSANDVEKIGFFNSLIELFMSALVP